MIKNSVKFGCPELELAVREQLGKPEGQIDIDDMKSLKSLNGSYNEICSLEGIELAENLSVLELLENPITDISPISKLQELTSLSLAGNEIEDITPLSNLSKLKSLDISINKIKDVRPIANLHKLVSLDISRNEVEDITPLSNLSKLKSLDISINKIKDLRPIAKLRSLSTANLYPNPYRILILPDENKTKLSYVDIAGAIALNYLKNESSFATMLEFIYNPTTENAVEILKANPSMAILVRCIMDEDGIMSIFKQIVQNPKLHANYIKRLSNDEALGEEWEDLIGDFACNEVKKKAMKLILKKGLS